MASAPPSESLASTEDLMIYSEPQPVIMVPVVLVDPG